MISTESSSVVSELVPQDISPLEELFEGLNQKAQISLHACSFAEFVLINISAQSYLQSQAL